MARECRPPRLFNPSATLRHSHIFRRRGSSPAKRGAPATASARTAEGGGGGHRLRDDRGLAPFVSRGLASARSTSPVALSLHGGGAWLKAELTVLTRSVNPEARKGRGEIGGLHEHKQMKTRTCRVRLSALSRLRSRSRSVKERRKFHDTCSVGSVQRECRSPQIVRRLFALRRDNRTAKASDCLRCCMNPGQNVYVRYGERSRGLPPLRSS